MTEEFKYDIPGYIIAMGLIYVLPLTSMSVVNPDLFLHVTTNIPCYIIAVGLIYLLPLTSMSVVNCNLPWSLVYKKCKNEVITMILGKT